MDEIDRLFKRIIAEPVKACAGHKPVVEIGKDKRPVWHCLICGERWPITTGRRSEARGGLS